MLAFRIADRRHPIFDSTGAFLHGARWNSPGKRVIYAAQTYAGALLEILVHANLGVLPATQAVISIDIPDDLAVEQLSMQTLQQGLAGGIAATRTFGDRWLSECRSAVLLVPSVILQGRENNVLLNPAHPEFCRIHPGEPEPVIWDARLSARSLKP